MQVADMDAPLAPPAAGISAVLKRHSQAIGATITVVLTVLALVVLKHTLASLRWHDVTDAIAAIPLWRVGAAILLSGLSYFALTFYDVFAVRTLGQQVKWRTAAFASFTSYTLSHNLGFSVLTGGSARLRAYTRAGFSFADVARITLLASLNFWGGVLVLVAIALLVSPARTVSGIPIGAAAAPVIALMMIATLALPFVARWSGVRTVRIGGLWMPMPTLRIMSAQLLVSAVDLACASAALFILVPGLPVSSFPTFIVAYALGLVAGLVTHVPGGVGVFETVILATVPAAPDRAVAALLIYRIIYYLAPLALSSVLMLAAARRRQGDGFGRAFRLPLRLMRATAPTVSASLVFVGGVLLLFSDATPSLASRLHVLHAIVPLPFVEASHFFASLVGTALLLIAPSLQARQRTGFLLARALLVGGCLFSIAKGIDYEEATILLLFAGYLQIASPAFYRKSGLLSAHAKPWWLLAAAAVLALSFWAGMISYRHVPYASDLWWDFAWRGDAPRFLRATLGGGVLIASFAVWRIMSMPEAAAKPRDVPIDLIEAGLAHASRSDAALAFTGDKSFIEAADRQAFLMYRCRGRSCVVMGDPVGPQESWPELAWRIREECDRTGRRLCVYQASTEFLPICIELGLHPIKYGEEAVVELRSGFSLEGGRRKSLRHAVRRAEAAGLAFEIAPRATVEALMPDLQGVSDAWLGNKRKPEKGFSLGRFDPDYLRRFDCALLRHEGRIVAFANIWDTPNREELSIDLMRYDPSAPSGVMDLLFVRLMQLGAARGYSRFNLGLAPLSGLSTRHLAPLWSRAGATLFEHGERLYGFSGLRTFKEKFGPTWVPRYIAGPRGLAGWLTLADVAALVRG